MILHDDKRTIMRMHDGKNIIISYYLGKIVYRYRGGLDIVYYKDGLLKSVSYENYDESLGIPVGLVVIPAHQNKNGKTTICSLPIMWSENPAHGLTRNDGLDGLTEGTLFSLGTVINGLADYEVGALPDSAALRSALNGKENTEILKQFSKEGDIIDVCNKFQTLGVPAGSWYLPSIGLLRKLYTNGLHRFAASLIKIGENDAYYPNRNASDGIRFDALTSSTMFDPSSSSYNYPYYFIFSRTGQIEPAKADQYLITSVRAFADVELSN